MTQCKILIQQPSQHAHMIDQPAHLLLEFRGVAQHSQGGQAVDESHGHSLVLIADLACAIRAKFPWTPNSSKFTSSLASEQLHMAWSGFMPCEKLSVSF